MKQKIVKFFLLILITIGVLYFTPRIISVVYFLGLLAFYFRSKDEAFWLAFFLVLADGFFSLLGSWSAVISIIPGLPAIEVVQFYILLTLIKARKVKDFQPPFFSLQISIIFIYILFLVLQGQVLGLSGALNVQFRVVKYLMPLFLFYSIPRLIKTEKAFREIMTYLFPVAFIALVTQIFTIYFGLEPAQVLGLSLEESERFDVSDGNTYRGFFNFCILIITLFGALFYLSLRDKKFHHWYLYCIILADFLAVFLSATRGWILGFSVIIGLYFLLLSGIAIRHLIRLTFITGIISLLLISIPVVRIQLTNSINRLLTLEHMAQGDITAGDTLLRLNERGPRVMAKWKESPLTGFGFSDDFFQYSDIHVANQNILLHAGIAGAFLMVWFFLTFNLRILFRSFRLPGKHPMKAPLLVFNIVFVGWFLIHSSSGQHFTFYQITNLGIIQALFFTFGAIIYQKSFESEPQLSNDASSKKVNLPNKKVIQLQP